MALAIAVRWRARRRPAAARRLASLAAALAALQVALGALVPRAFAGEALWPQVAMGAAHQAAAVALFACLVMLAPRRAPEEAPRA